jgi:hypothetical protein
MISNERGIKKKKKKENSPPTPALRHGVKARFSPSLMRYCPTPLIGQKY